MSIENGIFGSTAPRTSAMSNRWLLRPKRVARNEIRFSLNGIICLSFTFGERISERDVKVQTRHV